MSKLISEEIVEAITLGDKEGFMSAFHSALAAKVSDALEIKKVEIASTLIAPASSEVVEEEVEQIDELDAGKGSILDRATKAARSKFKLSDINVRGTGMSKKTRDAHDRYTNFNFKSNQANHAQAAADASGTKYSDEYVSNIRQGKDWKVRMAKVKADRKAASDAKKAAKMAKEEVEQVDEATPEAKGQSRAEWRMGTPDVIAKNNAKIADKKARAKKKLMSMSIPAGKGK